MGIKQKAKFVTLQSLSYPIVRGEIKVALALRAIAAEGVPNPRKILGTYIGHGRAEDYPPAGAKKILWVGNDMAGSVFYFPRSAGPKTEGIR